MKIYLGLPYSGFELESFKLANKISAYLMNQGHVVFSPISMSHPIAVENDLPKDWKFWKQFDECFIDWCDMLIIVIMEHNGVDRIKKSTGVQAEIKIAMNEGKEIMYLHENKLTQIQ
jgi:nucleoside 2-deoxyribosyltransferase